MPDRYQETHIRHVPMFSQLPDYQFQLVAQTFQVYRYNAGDYILMQGTEVPGLIIIAEGQAIRVMSSADGTRSQQGTVYEGQFIYQNALFEAQRAGTHLQAVRPTTVLILTRAAMGTLLAHHPELKPAFGLERGTAHHLHDVQFRTQRENEQVLLKTRRHWFAMMRWMWTPIAFIIVGLLLSATFPPIAFFTVPIVFILGIIFAIYIILEWLNDSVVVTDQRVVRITHTILTFHEVRDEVALESIQEANAEIPTVDLFARIFRYGDVELKTAGSEGNYRLHFMPNPEKLQDLIIEDARNYRAANQTRERETMVAEVERWIEQPYRAGQGQKQYPIKQQFDAASEEKIKNIYTPGEGPISPFVMSFPTQNGGIVYRKHWFQWLSAITLPTLWIMGSLVAMLFMLFFAPMQTLGFIGWALAFVALLIGIVWFYLADWDWRHDYYLITDNNITIINQRPLWLQNESDQVLLKQVDNVVAETKGILQQLFRYGDVKVALVGADHHKLFDNVPNPREVQDEITRRQLRLKERETQQQEHMQREIVGEYLSLYHQRNQQANSEVFPENQPLPYEPQSQQPSQAQTSQNTPRPTPSPFGNRPSISAGRPYQGHAPQQPAHPQRSPYRPKPPQNQPPPPPVPPQQQGDAMQYPPPPQPNPPTNQGNSSPPPPPPPPFPNQEND